MALLSFTFKKVAIMLRLLWGMVCALSVTTLLGQSPLGAWKTIDDETGEAKSYVEIYESSGKLFGKVARLLKSAPDKKCEKCPDERKGKPLLGMVILENMQYRDGHWQSGRILDPEKGKWYTCKLWLKEGDSDVLVVRGYLGPFYRTQYWYRVPAEKK